MIRRILVTGATGFVAHALLSRIPAGYEYVATSRRSNHLASTPWRPSPHLSSSADWRSVLEGIDSVVHLAGRVHVSPDGDASPFFIENLDGTIKLAEDAVSAGVRRLVYVSTAKVLGDESGPVALLEGSPARPQDPYAASKLATEQGLSNLGGKIQVAVLRPPLVYGPGVKANFLALLSAVARGVPMPLASVRNRRSLVGVANLASAITACLESPKAAGRTYHVTDGEPCSTPALVQAIASAFDKPSRLFPFPPRLLEICGGMIGRAETVQRLTRSLELDDRAIRSELGWRPVQTFEEGIAETVRWYQGSTQGEF